MRATRRFAIAVLAAAATYALMLHAALGADVPEEFKAFQGEWKVLLVLNDGAIPPDEEREKLRLVVAGDERVIKSGDMIKSKAKFKVDPKAEPKTMDVEVSEGKLAGKKLVGIYEIKDDEFVLCLSLEGNERPTEFSADPGSGRLLQVFKREKA